MERNRGHTLVGTPLATGEFVIVTEYAYGGHLMHCLASSLVTVVWQAGSWQAGSWQAD